jgi:ferredoxin-nitrite reductase
MAEAVEPEKILYYIKAMWLTFRAYGNYENRGKARTRYMQESLGGEAQYRAAYLEKLQEVFDSGENLDLSAGDLTGSFLTKSGNGSTIEDRRVIVQNQPGLYTVVWHPIGGQPDPKRFCELADLVGSIEGAEVRLAPDETAYIINLNGDEAAKVLAATDDSAATLFETSVSCIGAAICQVGVRDSQALLAACVAAVREAGLPDGALPQIHISGCPSSCGTHQTGVIGFRGAAKKAEGKAQSAFMLYVGGEERQGEEKMGCEYGTILERRIPEFLVKLGRAVSESGLDFDAWRAQNPEKIREIAEEYTREVDS